ncbi:hypothetical protein [Isoptericola rhizosphaerae]|uniref:hypothetical protein n=1 Tax=Isoptericola rhizosphaerae TaxID=3377837 RepID=UPI003839D684
MWRDRQSEHDRWASVLDDLEAMATGAVGVTDEAMVRRLLDWEPPVDIGRVPVDLRPRALDVLDRMSDVADRLRALVADHRRQARALDGVPRAHDPGAAAYLDVCA